MDNKIFKQFQWHDLPLEELIIKENTLSFIVTPFDDDMKCYKGFKLILKDFSTIKLSEDLSKNIFPLLDAEIYSFDYVLDGQIISGKISIIFNDRNFGTIEFKNAKFELLEIIKQ